MDKKERYSILPRWTVMQKVDTKGLKAVHLYRGLEMMKIVVEKRLVFSPIVVITPEFNSFLKCWMSDLQVIPFHICHLII